MPLTKKLFVVAIDFWEPSKNALEMAARFALQFDGELIAVHIMEKSAHYPDHIEVDHDTLEEDLEKAMEDLLQPLRDRGVAIESEVREGNVTRILSDIVHEHQANILFLGLREGRILDDIFIGKHTLQLIKTADVPVIVVDGTPHDDVIDELLIPLDRQFGIDGTVQFLRNFGMPMAERIKMLTGMLPTENEEAVRGEALVAAQQLEGMGVESVDIQLVEDNDVYAAIMDLIRDSVGTYDLVLLEHHDYISRGEMTLGSLVEDVVTKGRMPVLCAPSTKKR